MNIFPSFRSEQRISLWFMFNARRFLSGQRDPLEFLSDEKIPWIRIGLISGVLLVTAVVLGMLLVSGRIWAVERKVMKGFMFQTFPLQFCELWKCTSWFNKPTLYFFFFFIYIPCLICGAQLFTYNTRQIYLNIKNPVYHTRINI